MLAFVSLSIPPFPYEKSFHPRNAGFREVTKIKSIKKPVSKRSGTGFIFHVPGNPAILPEFAGLDRKFCVPAFRKVCPSAYFLIGIFFRNLKSFFIFFAYRE
jgi:hypothetical protein